VVRVWLGTAVARREGCSVVGPGSSVSRGTVRANRCRPSVHASGRELACSWARPAPPTLASRGRAFRSCVRCPESSVSVAAVVYACTVSVRPCGQLRSVASGRDTRSGWVRVPRAASSSLYGSLAAAHVSLGVRGARATGPMEWRCSPSVRSARFVTAANPVQISLSPPLTFPASEARGGGLASAAIFHLNVGGPDNCGGTYRVSYPDQPEGLLCRIVHRSSVRARDAGALFLQGCQVRRAGVEPVV
jgi:hypothetical protein